MSKIQLSLITNHDPKRYSYITDKLEELAFYLGAKGYQVTFIEPGYQPEMRQADISTTFRQTIAYWVLNRKWCTYRKIRKPFILLDLLVLTNSLVTETLTEKKRRRAFRDIVVPVNHAIAWKAAADSGSDYCIVFEDDALFNPDSMERVKGLINILPSFSDMHIYIDLAGGLRKADLQINKLEEGRVSGGYTFYRKPVTNTACCYLINLNMAKFFTEQINAHNSLKLLGADHQINAMFLNLERARANTFCMHSDPPVFRHGSMTGEYE